MYRVIGRFLAFLIVLTTSGVGENVRAVFSSGMRTTVEALDLVTVGGASQALGILGDVSAPSRERPS